MHSTIDSLASHCRILIKRCIQLNFFCYVLQPKSHNSLISFAMFSNQNRITIYIAYGQNRAFKFQRTACRTPILPQIWKDSILRKKYFSLLWKNWRSAGHTAAQLKIFWAAEAQTRDILSCRRPSSSYFELQTIKLNQFCAAGAQTQVTLFGRCPNSKHFELQTFKLELFWAAGCIHIEIR